MPGWCLMRHRLLRCSLLLQSVVAEISSGQETLALLEWVFQSPSTLHKSSLLNFFFLLIYLFIYLFFLLFAIRCVRFTQQLVIFAPQAISIHSHVQTLLSTLSSRQVSFDSSVETSLNQLSIFLTIPFCFLAAYPEIPCCVHTKAFS